MPIISKQVNLKATLNIRLINSILTYTVQGALAWRYQNNTIENSNERIYPSKARAN